MKPEYHIGQRLNFKGWGPAQVIGIETVNTCNIYGLTDIKVRFEKSREERYYDPHQIPAKLI